MVPEITHPLGRFIWALFIVFTLVVAPASRGLVPG